MVGDARAERVVLGALGLSRPRALLGLVCAPAGFGSRPARRRRGDLDGVAADATPARGLREPLELVGGLVDRLQVALVLVAPAGWGDVGMPALGHPPPPELYRALVERGLELEQQQRLFEIEHPWHGCSYVSDADRRCGLVRSSWQATEHLHQISVNSVSVAFFIRIVTAMSAPSSNRRPRTGAVVVAGVIAGTVVAGLGAAVLSMVVSVFTQGSDCSRPDAITLAPSGTGQLVGATEYGGAGDPTSGTVGSSGANLIEHPDSYAELGGYTFQTATAMGGLPYMTPLRITWGRHSAIAYKRDFGLGGGPVRACRA